MQIMTMITPMSMRQMITITVMKRQMSTRPMRTKRMIMTTAERHRRSTQPMRMKRMTTITWIMTVMRKRSSMTSTSGLLR